MVILISVIKLKVYRLASKQRTIQLNYHYHPLLLDGGQEVLLLGLVVQEVLIPVLYYIN